MTVMTETSNNVDVCDALHFGLNAHDDPNAKSQNDSLNPKVLTDLM
jgi:hypothetical protein